MREAQLAPGSDRRTWPFDLIPVICVRLMFCVYRLLFRGLCQVAYILWLVFPSVLFVLCFVLLFFSRDGRLEPFSAASEISSVFSVLTLLILTWLLFG